MSNSSKVIEGDQKKTKSACWIETNADNISVCTDAKAAKTRCICLKARLCQIPPHNR